MISASLYPFGNVVLAPFPFSNLSDNKKWPAMAITGQVHTPPDFASFPIIDWQAAGLLKPSFAKPIITTIEHTLIIRGMRRFSALNQQSLRQMLARILG